jgi:hypothetical protein
VRARADNRRTAHSLIMTFIIELRGVVKTRADNRRTAHSLLMPFII